MSLELTPMMKQYHLVKESYPDAILFYRLGDFYEMFFDDAVIASKLLDLTLTSRNKNQEDKVPMCGIPAHAAGSYIQKLLGNGLKVAICEQVEDPALSKGLVKREVVQILTPGLVFDPACLDSKESNYLVSVAGSLTHWGLAKCDITTGHFVLMEFGNENDVMNEISRIEPKEIIIAGQKNKSWNEKLTDRFPKTRLNERPSWCFETEYSDEMYHKYYQAHPLGLGLHDAPLAALCGGALLGYLHENKVLKESILKRPQINFQKDFLILDETAKKNLELIHSQPGGEVKGSLFGLLDQAMTPMGSRRVRDWILYPLLKKETILERLEVVSLFYQDSSQLRSLRTVLATVSDIERLANRVLADQANPRDLVAISESLKAVPALLEKLKVFDSILLNRLRLSLNPLPDLCGQIDKTIIDEPPISIKEGGFIRHSVNSELDELRDIEKNSLTLISQMETLEREKTGISSLKIRYNRVFGYYIEITNTHKDKAPDTYIRKQTLANAERYITPELKLYEDKVLGASEKTRILEYDLFVGLRRHIASQAVSLKNLAEAISVIDALSSLAFVAIENHYSKPEIVTEPVLEIIRGRHPLVEASHLKDAFIPNDVTLKYPEQYLMIITGPNMAGKSTVMRQVALIVLMAQMGSFVPADKAIIGLADRIFTRIGASDSLQKGQSTFMVEMIETAQILSSATPSSLVILDEIGRGTSTFDGLSIAWAVAETIHDSIKARTMFATHYHELTDLAENNPGAQNYHMVVREWNHEIRFLRELKKGGTNRSLGVHVAKMAGLPQSTIARAKEILLLLEKKDLSFQNEARHIAQPSLFEVPAELREIMEQLKNIDINQMTPLKALNCLMDFKIKLQDS